MQILTLIPNAKDYGMTVLMLLMIGSFNIARHVHVRWLKDQCSLITTNALIKNLIVLIGLLIVPVTSLFTMNAQQECTGAIVGIIFGLIIIQIEENLLRKTNRNYLIKKKITAVVNDQTIFLHPTIRTKMCLSSKPALLRGIHSIKQSNQVEKFVGYNLTAVILVAFAEECLFRGYFYVIANQLSSPVLMCSLLILSTLIFAFSHMSTTWTEGIHKLPLSILSLLAIMLTGTLTAAITTHVIVNTNAWRQMKKWQRKKLEMQSC